MAEMQVATIIRQLADEEHSLVSVAEALRARLTETEDELQRIRSAREALEPKRNSRGTRKRAPTREDVKQAIAVVIKEQGRLTVEALRQEVATRISGLGCSHVGYTLRFQEALRELKLTKPTSDVPASVKEVKGSERTVG